MSRKITTKYFITEALKVHGNTYDYSQSVYVDAKTKINIICKKHGVFEQRKDHHLNGRGCPECGGNKKGTSASFTAKSIAVHGDTYDYSKVNYTNNHTKVIVTCHDHGDFEVAPAHHLKGHGCPRCVGRKNSTEDYIEDAKKVHGDLYDYSKTIYTKSNEKGIFICKEHGEFKQVFSSHMQGIGCPECAHIKRWNKRGRLTLKEFKKKAHEVHGKKYKYLNIKRSVVKGENRVFVEMTCKKHDYTFQQTPYNHLKGAGCIKCAGVERHTTESYIKKCEEVHGDTYDYSKVEYVNAREDVTIICKKHGDFQMAAGTHSTSKAHCPKCAYRTSKKETEIMEYLEGLGCEVDNRNRELIYPHEVDLVLHEQKIAVEFNGLYWHTEKWGKDQSYHINKTKACNDVGYRLVHIWEDDYDNKKEIVLNFLKHLVGKDSSKRVYARKTQLKEITNTKGKAFIDKYHIQGSSGASVYIGAYFEDDLVAVTAFQKGKSNTANRHMWELVRHVTHGNVVGSLGKAIKFFGEPLYTFCDISYFNGHSYLKAGFIKVSSIKPDYKYFVLNKREHKFNWRNDKRISLYPETADMTEREGMKHLGLERIWDCGKDRYEYTPPKR